MKYYSDVTKKMYETIDELVKAEEDAEQLKKEAEKRAIEKKAIISELDKKIKNYLAELETIVQDYKVTTDAYNNACADFEARYKEIDNKIIELKREKAMLRIDNQVKLPYNDIFRLFNTVFK